MPSYPFTFVELELSTSRIFGFADPQAAKIFMMKARSCGMTWSRYDAALALQQRKPEPFAFESTPGGEPGWFFRLWMEGQARFNANPVPSTGRIMHDGEKLIGP